jgi:hypothetical protein
VRLNFLNPPTDYSTREPVHWFPCLQVAHPSLLNPDLLKAQYAVRGELYNKALELQKQGRDLIFTNGELR